MVRQHTLKKKVQKRWIWMQHDEMKEKPGNGSSCSVPHHLVQGFFNASDIRLEDRKTSFMMVAAGKPTSFPRAPSPHFPPGRGQKASAQHKFVAGNRLELIPSWGCLFLLKYFPPLQLACPPVCESI